MTREEFREGILDMLEAIKDPNDDIHRIVKEFHELGAELGQYDQVLGVKVTAIVDTIQSLIDHVKTRGEVS